MSYSDEIIHDLLFAVTTVGSIGYQGFQKGALYTYVRTPITNQRYLRGIRMLQE